MSFLRAGEGLRRCCCRRPLGASPAATNRHSDPTVRASLLLPKQDKYLRAVASDPGLWHPLALARWPGADAEAGHSGDWHKLYQARASQPHAFPLAADRVRAVTAAQQRRRQAEQREAAVGAVDAAVSAATAPAGTSSASSSGVGGLPALAFEDVMHQAYSAGLACTRCIYRLKLGVYAIAAAL